MTGRVEISGAEVRFKAMQALAPTDLVLEPGSFTALIGPSGCGKSTLLNAIAGFTGLASGTLTVDGRPVRGPSPQVGVVFQQYALFPWFTARGNVEFALKRLRLGRDAQRQAAEAALAEVGLAGRGDNFPAQLSGGMKQRVALARTLAAQPAVLLMDEPFGALDAQTRAAMHELLLGVWLRRRTTILFVTHDVDEALVLSDRIHVMAAGPGRIIETIELGDRSGRAVDKVGPEYVAQRNRIIGLLRHTTPEGAHA